MMKSCLISILVSLASFTTAWGQASGTQVTETDSTLTLRNSKVRVEFPKGEAFDISKLTLNGKELVLSKGYNTVPLDAYLQRTARRKPGTFPLSRRVYRMGKDNEGRTCRHCLQMEHAAYLPRSGSGSNDRFPSRRFGTRLLGYSSGHSGWMAGK